MRYHEIIRLKDGRACCLRNGDEQDGQAALDSFMLAHAQTDFLRTYPDEKQMTPEQEAQFLKETTASDRAIELLAEVEGHVAGLAGIAPVGHCDKERHRATFGISIDRNYWGLGIGRALTEACIACARAAGYAQLELDVVADNARAVGLYQRLGFVEYGRNPRGFRSRLTGWQPVTLMRMELDGE